MFVGIPIEWHEPLDNAPSIAGWWDLLGDWPAIVSDYLPFDLPVPLWTHDIAGVWRYQQRISALKPRVPTFLSFSTGEPWGEKVREKAGRGKGDRFQIQGEGGVARNAESGEQLDMRHLAVFDDKKGKGHEVGP